MKIGFVKEVFGSVPHIAAFENNGKIEVKSITSFGETIINDFDFDKQNIGSSIPAGFMFTGFFENPESSSEKQIAKSQPLGSLVFSKSVVKNTTSSKSPIFGIGISKFKHSSNKVNAVSFKASRFRNLTKRGELVRRIDGRKTALDSRLRKITSNRNNEFSEIAEIQMRADFTDGFIRKSFEKIALDKKVSRRIDRRSKTLENLASTSRVDRNSTLSLRIERTRKEVKRGG